MENLKKEYMILIEKPADTQKKIRTWLSSGYTIEIVTQSYCCNEGILFTSFYRIKKD